LNRMLKGTEVAGDPTYEAGNPYLLASMNSTPAEIADIRSQIPDVSRPDLESSGVRMLQLNEEPISRELVALLRIQIPDVIRPELDPLGVRRPQVGEQPLSRETVVGASSGVAEWQTGESP